MIGKSVRGMGVALLGLLLAVQLPAAHAGLITTDQVAGQAAAGERDRVGHFLERSDVRERLQALGVEGTAAQERVAALDDQEVHALAQRIDSLPGGGHIGTFSDDQLIIVLLIIIVVLLVATA